MPRTLLLALLSFLVPVSVSAAPASFSAGQSLLAATSSPGNEYLAGASVVVTAPVAGDLTAVAGSVVAAAPISGDELLLGGSISSRAPVSGDARIAGGSIVVDEPVNGDLIAIGLSVRTTAYAQKSVFIMAADALLSGGAGGPVTVYGNNISLAGDFASNVHIVSSGRVTLAPNTVIHGTLSYESPEAAVIPPSAMINGGIEYTNASYLPGAATSRSLAFISIGVFLLARILGALLLAGLLTGLFPRLAGAVVRQVYGRRVRSVLLTLLLGFAVSVATPILLVFLSLTFVGLGLALLIGIGYCLLLLLSVLYAGILLGCVLVRRYGKRERILWRDGVMGMLALSLIALVPFVGPGIVLVLTFFCVGALSTILFRTAFPHDGETAELVY